MDLSNLTIKKARQLLDSKQVSSIQLTQYYLNQIENKDKDINAFITVCKESALKQAEAADKRIQDGETNELLGIPYSIKDSFLTKGILTTAGSKVLSNFIAPYNGTVVQRLESLGAILIGKTNLDAWGHGGSTENSDYGITKNPYDFSRVSGGSSGGSAASVASDMCLFSIAEDTGGSIRLPAGFCGTYGLKVTYGRVSRYGCIAYASSLDTVGPITRDVNDLQIILNAIGGKDEKDATVQNLETGAEKIEQILKNDNSKPLYGIKFALPKEYLTDGIDSEVADKFKNLINKVESLGGEIKNVSIPSTKYCIPTYYVIAFAETSTNLARYDGIRYGNHVNTNKGWMEDVVAMRSSYISTETKRRIMLGTYVLSAGYYDAYYLKAQKVRAKLIKEFDEVYKDCDVILSPISPTPAFHIGENTSDPMKMYLEDVFTVTANLVGGPSLAIPFGRSSANLPIGLQLIGNKWSEKLLISIGACLK